MNARSITLLLPIGALFLQGCATPSHVVQGEANGLPTKEVVRFIADSAVASRASPTVVRVKDLQRDALLPYSHAQKKSVTALPGLYEVDLHCLTVNQSSAVPSIKIEAKAGFTYLLHCYVDGNRVTVRARAEPTPP